MYLNKHRKCAFNIAEAGLSIKQLYELNQMNVVILKLFKAAR